MKRVSARIICLACSMSLIFGSGIIVAHSNLSNIQEVKAIYSLLGIDSSIFLF